MTIRHLAWCGFAIAMVYCNKELRFSKVGYYAVGFLCFTLISFLFALNKSEWLYAFLRCILFVIFMAFIKIDTKKLGKTMVILGVLFTFYFWFEFFKDDIINYPTRIAGMTGLMGQRNYWAAAQFFIIPFCYYAWTNRIWKKLSIAVAISMVINIMLLGSKSVILAFFISSVIIRKKLVAVLFPLLCLIVALNYYTLKNSLYTRFVQWKPTLKMISDKPFGFGVGNWWIEFPAYARNIDMPGAYTELHFRFPHNDFLWVCAEVGILGFACYLMMFYSAFVSTEKYIQMFLLGYIVVAFFCALHERAFPSIMLCIMLAVSHERNRTIGKPQLLLCLMIFVLVVFSFRVRSAYYNQKMVDAKDPQEILESTKKAYSVFSTLDYSGKPYYWWMGWANYTMKRKESYSQFERAYKYNPYNIQTLNGMGLACIGRGKLPKAKTYFLKALDICSKYKEASMNLKELNRIK